MKIQLDFNDYCGIEILPIEENEVPYHAAKNFGYKFNVFVVTNDSKVSVPEGFNVYSFSDLAKLGLVDENFAVLDNFQIMPFVAKNWPHWKVKYNGTYHPNTVMLYREYGDKPVMEITGSEQTSKFTSQVRQVFNPLATKVITAEEIEKDL